MNDKKVILYIAMSLDGYIAKPNDDLSFLSIVEKVGEDYGYSELLSQVDTIILGRKTYDWVMQLGELPYKDKNVYIITRTFRPNKGKIVFYSGNLTELIHNLKIQNEKNILCEGGAEIVNELLRKDLIDELIISIIPILVGKGIRLFDENRPEQLLKLISVKTFESGLIQLHYKRFNQDKLQ
ncbi:MAG: dihydrofolate reductase family protein [Leptospiraceae bacterium]|jgi:dihydrofolate reductase|nr:dihydrofolate reductase family protein [Leptospiraceae bacterium]